MAEFNENQKAAEAIVNDYGTALSIESEGFARPASLLNNSKEEIKEAIKAYIEALIATKRLSKELCSILSFGYASVELFTDDDEAEFINKLGKKKEKLSEDLYSTYSDYVQETTLAMKRNIAEITDFLKVKIESI
jgi:polyribonucleotide nucleotidyltransferase